MATLSLDQRITVLEGRVDRLDGQFGLILATMERIQKDVATLKTDMAEVKKTTTETQRVVVKGFGP